MKLFFQLRNHLLEHLFVLFYHRLEHLLVLLLPLYRLLLHELHLLLQEADTFSILQHFGHFVMLSE